MQECLVIFRQVIEFICQAPPLEIFLKVKNVVFFTIM